MDTSSSVKDELQRLFEIAATKRMVVVDSLDAEPEMVAFVDFVRCHPELREVVVGMIMGSFSEEYYLTHPPIGLWQFLMHALRWREVHGFFMERKSEEVHRRGARCSGVWDDLLDAFDDDWEAAKLFEYFLSRRSGCA